MASLALRTRVGVSANYTQQLNIYEFYTYSTTPNYVHFKTNISASGGQIVTLEAIGFNYGNALPIRCTWSLYATGNAVYDSGRVNKGTGLDANGVYKSSDGYAVIRAYASGFYYAGWVLNAYSSAYYYAGDIQITAANQNATSGSYY